MEYIKQKKDISSHLHSRHLIKHILLHCFYSHHYISVKYQFITSKNNILLYFIINFCILYFKNKTHPEVFDVSRWVFQRFYKSLFDCLYSYRIYCHIFFRFFTLGFNPADAKRHIKALVNLAENGISVIKPRQPPCLFVGLYNPTAPTGIFHLGNGFVAHLSYRRCHKIELTAVRVPAAVGHCQSPCVIVQKVGKFIGKRHAPHAVAAVCGAVRGAGLNYKIFYNTVKCNAVVIS